MKRSDTAIDPVEQASTWCLRVAEGPLPADEDARLRAWLAADPAHAAAFDDAARAWRAFEACADAPEVIALRHAALARLGQGRNDRARARNRRRRWWSLAAACVGLFAAAGALLWLQFLPTGYHTALGERQVVVLEDGSRLTLDADSHVDVRYRTDRRELRLRRGRATFEVARDPLRPFSVSAADKLVVATGTAFSVELVAREVRVVLYQGGVDVLSGAPGGRRLESVARTTTAAREPVARMSPGNELVAAVDSPRSYSHPIDPARTRAWEAGLLAFNDEPLSAAVERINRHALPRLEIEDPAIATLRISGTFTAGDNAAFVEGVTGVFPVRAIARDGHIALVSAR